MSMRAAVERKVIVDKIFKGNYDEALQYKLKMEELNR